MICAETTEAGNVALELQVMEDVEVRFAGSVSVRVIVPGRSLFPMPPFQLELKQSGTLTINVRVQGGEWFKVWSGAIAIGPPVAPAPSKVKRPRREQIQAA